MNILSILTMMIMATSAIALLGHDAGAAPEGSMELMDIAIDIEFTSILDYDITAEMEVYNIFMNGTVLNSTELRTLYQADPDLLTSELDEELTSRVMNITVNSLSGDDLEIVSSDLELPSIAPELGDEAPVRYVFKITGSTDASRFLSDDLQETIDPDRMEEVATGLLLSGFEFSRTVTLRSGEGKRVTYTFPQNIDPIGDGDLSIELYSSEFTPDLGKYSIFVDGESGDMSRTFPFKLMAQDPKEVDGEVVSGSILLDWSSLEMMDLDGVVSISSIDVLERNILSDLPASMKAPDHLGSGTLRWALSEGLMKNEDRSKLESDVASEVEEGLLDALDVDQINTSAYIDPSSIPSSVPVSGAEIEDLVLSDDDLEIIVSTEEPVVLDVLDGYEEQDVMDLINGGLKINREMSQPSDDRFDVMIELPDQLLFENEEAVSSNGNRSTYAYFGGMKSITSSIAPQFKEEKVSISSRIDLSEVRSDYISDLQLTLKSESTISISVLEFDPADFTFETDLDFTMDYLSSDLIRLLLKMEIAMEEDITDDIEERVVDLLSGLVDEEDLEISVVLERSTIEYTSDGSVDGEDPIMIDITAGGGADPFDSSSSYMGSEYMPFHMDPIFPVRTIERTIDIGSISRWDPEVEVHFPSGTGVSAWILNDSDEKAGELDVEIQEGHPVLIIGPESPEGDGILLELEIGAYFGFNHVTVCFFSFWGFLIFFILLIVVIIIRKIVKKKKAKTEKENDDGDDEGDGTGREDKDPEGKNEEASSDGDLKW